MQTERAKRMDSAGEEASLNSPELPWIQLYLKRRTESRIQLRRRVCFTGPAAAVVTGVLAILILAAGSVSSDSEFVTVPSSVKCTEGQDCILSCSFDYTAGGWDMWSYVVWRREETSRIVHSYHDNTEQLAHQLPQYVNRTSLFDSELQCGNASLLLKRVREEDAGNYSCSVYPHKLHGSGLIELVLVPAQPTSAAITAEPTSAAAVLNVRHPWWVSGAVLVYWVAASFCIGLKLYIQRSEMQTERAKRMDSAGEEASLNSPELPWNQLYLKRRTESRIQLRRRVCFTGPAAAAVTGVLAILILAAGSVSSDSEFVTVPSSVKCTERQDCILSCSFDYTAGGWDEKSGVVWRRTETDHIVHSYHDNMDQLDHQLPQYVSRTSLFDSELQRGNASLLLRRVREEDAGNYSCSVYTPGGFELGLTEVVVVPAQGFSWAISVWVTAGLCAVLLLQISVYIMLKKIPDVSLKAQYSPPQAVGVGQDCEKAEFPYTFNIRSLDEIRLN
ncbi:UNVERIFIED_CONTAM: hypothetical protein FKN15_026681 [Acipenser sinensis]